jgi:glycosyltransferase involved in cell wall biosynthesis
MNNPSISIIIVVKNDAFNLSDTLASIDLWDKRIEVLVKDGLSIDNTKEIISQYLNKNLRFENCSDKGIYDAMNQAIQLVTGRYVMFLNAGEILLPGSLEKIIQTINSNSDIYKFLVQTENNQVRIERGSITFFSRYMLNHQGLIYHKDRCFADNLYSSNFKIVGDLRHILEKKLWKKIIYIDELIVKYKGGGVATNFNSIGTNWHERMTIFFWNDVGFVMRAFVFAISIIGYSYWLSRKLFKRLGFKNFNKLEIKS